MPKGNVKYEYVKQNLLEKMQAGIYPVGSKLPSEAALCKEFDASRITVRRALDELAAKGILEKKQGIGSFVTDMNAVRKIAAKPKIAVILPAFFELKDTAVFSKLLRGVQDALEAGGCVMTGIMGLSCSEDEERLLNNIRDISPAGVIFPYFAGNGSMLDALRHMNLPTVFIDCMPEDAPFDQVGGDNYNSAYRAAKLMLDTGIKKIGFFSPVSTAFVTARQRMQGVRDALSDDGFPVLERMFFAGGFTLAKDPYQQAELRQIDILDSVRKYLQRNPDLEGIITLTDVTAMFFYLACSEMKKQIPNGLKVISYGNYYGHSQIEGGLTSYELFSYDSGHQAAKLLLQRMQRELPAERQMRRVYYELIRRESF